VTCNFIVLEQLDEHIDRRWIPHVTYRDGEHFT
jgi:hypothetical protein